ncbi:MAG: ABC transporter substrate-binding protein [Thermomicrobiales bacterium]
MSQRDTQDLNDKIYANWQRFYREGRINRRTLMQAMMVWAGAASVGGLLAACGGSAENTPSGGGAATAPSGGATAPAGGATAPTGGATAPAGGATAPTGGAATEGGMLRVILDQNDLPTMDPHMHNLRTGIIFFYHTHDNLGVRNRETNQIEPWLAESWENIEPTVWEMKLRSDVKFHNGDPFTAATVKWNWDRVTNPDQKSQQMGNHSQIAGVDIVDDYTVHVKTKAPYPIFTERLQNFQMIPEKLAQEKGDAWLAENPVGSGPYKFVEWKHGQSITLTRNDDYWNKDVRAPYKDLTIRFVPGVPTQLAELLAGNVDIIRVVPYDQMKAVEDSGVAMPITQAILRVGYTRLDAMGRSGPNPFQDVKVRHAANHACDIQGYIDTLQPGGDRTPAMLNPKHFGFDPSIEPHDYNPDKAKQLLTEAGHPDGIDVKWVRGPSSMPNQDQVDQAMQRDLAAVGIRCEFETLSDGNVFTTRHNEGKAGPMHSYNWGSYSVFDADGIYWDQLHTGSIFTYYSNPELDALLDEGRSSLDQDHRKEVYSKAQRIVRDEAPVIFMWGFHSVWGVSNKIDWKPRPDEIDMYFTAKPKA